MNITVPDPASKLVAYALTQSFSHRSAEIRIVYSLIVQIHALTKSESLVQILLPVLRYGQIVFSIAEYR